MTWLPETNELNPGIAAWAVLPAHCHPQASVYRVGMEGEARVRHFEIQGDAPAFDSGVKTPFLIRETRSQIISPRRVSTLSSTRDNIHYFEAGDTGARGPEETVFEAVWTGMRL